MRTTNYNDDDTLQPHGPPTKSTTKTEVIASLVLVNGQCKLANKQTLALNKQ
jgi:hypothetical protein